MTMVRRQIYLGEAETRKVRRVARRRKMTESQVIREAIARLPEDEDDTVRRLREAGLLVEPPPPPISASEREAIQRKLDGVRGVELGAAVLEEREASRY